VRLADESDRMQQRGKMRYEPFIGGGDMIMIRQNNQDRTRLTSARTRRQHKSFR